MALDSISLNYIKTHPADVARALEFQQELEIGQILERLSAKDAACLIPHLSPIIASDCLAAMPAKQAARILRALPYYLAVSLMRRMLINNRMEILATSSAMDGMRRSFRYPYGSVGTVMDPNMLVLNEAYTIGEARQYLRKYPAYIQNKLFIVDEDQMLRGFIEIKDIVLASSTDKVSTLSRKVTYTLSPRADLEVVARDSAWNWSDVLPVVDVNGRLQGTLSRTVLIKFLADKGLMREDQTQASDLFLDVAEIFWETISETLVHDEGDQNANQ